MENRPVRNRAIALFKTDRFGIPIIDVDQIELKAEEVISHFDPGLLSQPKYIPVVEFIERIHHDYHIELDLCADLGETPRGSKILGKTSLQPLGVYLDSSLLSDPRFSFVLAHEFGHVVLHRRVDLRQSGYDGQELSDTQRDLVTGHKRLTNPRDWVEWQANCFAGAILMPRATVPKLVLDTQRRIGISRNLGRIILDNQQYSLRDYRTITRELQRVYGVNQKNAECRLRDLRILEDRRNADVKHISELWKTE